MARGPPTVETLNYFLSTRPNAPKDAQEALVKLLSQFVEANEDPQKSQNFRSPGGDDMTHLIKVAKNPAVERSEALILLLLKVFKILSRKQQNRAKLGEGVIKAVVKFLEKPKTSKIAGEGANVILNACYEKENVDIVLNCGGVKALVGFLTTEDQELQANAAGAIQSICFQAEGRDHVRDSGSIPHILKLLNTEDTKVQTRAVGALHNMSSDPETIRIIRREEGIPLLIDLLTSRSDSISGSAAGALQNVSREVASRRIIRQLDAIPALSALLAATDVQAQVCAAGALLNILGPDLGEDKSAPQRKAFGKLLTSCVVLGVMYGELFDISLRDELLA